MTVTPILAATEAEDHSAANNIPRPTKANGCLNDQRFDGYNFLIPSQLWLFFPNSAIFSDVVANPAFAVLRCKCISQYPDFKIRLLQVTRKGRGIYAMFRIKCLLVEEDFSKL